MSAESRADSALQRHAAQAVLFSPTVSRADMLALNLPDDDFPHTCSINVWRNHNFETLIGLMTPYCRFGRWRAQWRLGAYDDSLMFVGWQAADAELIWLDSTRLFAVQSFDAWRLWLSERLAVLRARSHAPIVVATWAGDSSSTQLRATCERLAAVYYLDLQALCGEQGVEFLQSRTAKLSGTPLSKAAQWCVARALACRALPGVLLPPIKAVAVDLDETLHRGVLSEDGAHALQLTDAHRALQLYLKSLCQRGVFVCLVSRNEASDVLALFAARQDYPLRYEDFSCVEVSWDDKALALQRIAQRLGIGCDAMVFVDDNAGELASVAARLPQMHTLLAEPDASITRAALSHYPGLWRWKTNADDAKRVADVQANRQRAVLAQEAETQEQYFRSLQSRLSIRYNPIEQLDRLAELSAKTNQFNLSLHRWNIAALRAYLEQPNAGIASVHLRDRLSDSGVIALICACQCDAVLYVHELCVSCRALGRGLEDSIVLLALRGMPGFSACQRVVFDVALGPRNQPAQRWLAALLGCEMCRIAEASEFSVSAAALHAFEPLPGLAVEVT